VNETTGIPKRANQLTDLTRYASPDIGSCVGQVADINADAFMNVRRDAMNRE
jgi:hypothetical protein